MTPEACLITEINPSNKGRQGTSAVPTVMSRGENFSLQHSERLTSGYTPADCVARKLLARATMLEPSVVDKPVDCGRCAGTIFLRKEAPLIEHY